MNSYYPDKTSSVISFESIINHKEKMMLHERMHYPPSKYIYHLF